MTNKYSYRELAAPIYVVEINALNVFVFTLANLVRVVFCAKRCCNYVYIHVGARSTHDVKQTLCSRDRTHRVGTETAYDCRASTAIGY